MKRSLGRSIYIVVFWTLVITIVVMNFTYLTGPLVEQAKDWGGPFYQVILSVIGLAAAVFLVYLQEAIANTYTELVLKATGGAEVNYEGEAFGKNLAKSARRLERKGDFTGAADAYEALEMWPEAARCLEQAGAYSRSATAWKRCGQADKAIAMFEKDGSFENAGDLAAAEGLRDRAVRNYRQAAERAAENNNFPKSALMYEKAFDFEKAAGIYERLKREFDAVRCYEMAGHSAKVDQILKEGELGRLWSTPDETRVEVASRIASMFLGEGKSARAAEIYASAGEMIPAAEAYERTGDWLRAAECYMDAERDDKAEAAIVRHKDDNIAAEFRARLAMKRGDLGFAGEKYLVADMLSQAVDCFKRAKRYVDAAQVYEKLGRPLMAADLYSTAKEFSKAADAYADARDWRSAAECYENIGNLARALECHASGGDYFRAGTIAQQLKDFKRAIELFQRVPPESPDIAQAKGFLGAAMYETGRNAAAADLLDKVHGQLARTHENLPVFYAYARLMEDMAPDRAVVAYRLILTIDFEYQDVEERMQRLEAVVANMPPLQAPSAGQPSAAGASGISTIPATGSNMTTMGGGFAIDPMRQFQPRMPEAVTPASSKFGSGGRYTIMQELGRGGMAIVFKAFDEHLQREVALKTFPLPMHGSSTREETFLREARLVARLSHTNIVTLFDCGRMDNIYYIAMEYVPGENLKQSVKRKGPMSLEEIRSVMRQLCDALMYAHAQAVLHLDIKPGNIIMRQSGELKVVDFGLARILSETVARGGATEDSQPTLVGTPQYMAPEQILASEVDERTDIYALGLTFFYLLTGRTPFDVKKVSDPVEISRLQVHTTFPRPSTLRATLPQKLDDVFVRCTQKNPADRYTSVKELQGDLIGV